MSFSSSIPTRYVRQERARDAIGLLWGVGNEERGGVRASSPRAVQWLRRRVMGMLQGLITATLGGSINRNVHAAIDAAFAPQQVQRPSRWSAAPAMAAVLRAPFA